MTPGTKIFIAIILGAIIIDGFCYFAIARQLVPQTGVRDYFIVRQNAAPKVFEQGAGLENLPNATVENSAIQASTPQKCLARENSFVTKVIDGDTVVVEGGWHVRLLGMDADEKGYLCYDAAKTRLEQLVLSKQVRLEKDVSDVDIYGRCLRTIFVGSENVNLKLVKEGLAIARFYAPDVKYKNEISAAEKQAIQNKTGCKWVNK